MIRVQTKYQGDKLALIQRDGTTALHSAEFTFKGREYYLLANVYYDLPGDLAKHIFRLTTNNKAV